MGDRSEATSANGEPAPSPAVAPPPANPRFALFDSLRGIAVLSIIVFHCAQFTKGIFDSWWGPYVQVLAHSLYAFFVISAFLLYRPFVRARVRGRKMRVGDYFRRRALRILPAYWFILTALAIWPAITGPFTGDWYIYYGFAQSYDADTFGLGISTAWSLCVELTFYLMLPVWAFVAARVRIGRGERAWLRGELALIGGFFLLGCVVRFLGNTGRISDLWAVNLPGQSSWLAIGMGLAVLSVALEGRRTRFTEFVANHSGLLWAGAGAAFIGLALTQPDPVLTTFQADFAGPAVLPRFLDTLWDEIVFTFLSAVLAAFYVLPAVFGEQRGGAPRRLLAWPVIGFVGIISYSMYLWHYTIGLLVSAPADVLLYPKATESIGLSDYIPEGSITIVASVLTILVTMAVSAATYYAVELPFLKRKETRLRPALRRFFGKPAEAPE